MNSSPTHGVSPNLNTTSSNCPFVITLDSSQHARYKAGCLAIQVPDGNFLETIRQYLQDHEIESSAARMQNQLYLVENLLAKMTNGIELSAKAVKGLVDLLYEMQGFCGRYIK